MTHIIILYHKCHQFIIFAEHNLCYGLLGRDTTSMPKIGISNPALGIAMKLNTSYPSPTKEISRAYRKDLLSQALARNVTFDFPILPTFDENSSFSGICARPPSVSSTSTVRWYQLSNLLPGAVPLVKLICIKLRSGFLKLSSTKEADLCERCENDDAGLAKKIWHRNII